MVAHVRPQLQRAGQNAGNPLATKGVPPNMFPNPEFIAKTLEDFPDAGVANVEQARVSQSASQPAVKKKISIKP